jgi:RNA-directed DNA polymerase
MVHRLFSTGAFDFEYTTVDAAGVKTRAKTPGQPAQLHGMLGFIDGVDLFNKTNVPKGSAKSLTSKELMYRRFLLYKDFYATASPIVVCEGKTDNVYIIHAIRSLAAAYPTLATVGPSGKIAINLRRFKYSGSSTGRILGITGGSDHLRNFIKTYGDELARFKAPGKLHPVIVLIDNDDGAPKIYSLIKELTGKKPTGDEPFIHVAGNLYVVPTPLLPAKKHSMIEDFFDASTLATLYKGRPFDPSNKFSSATHYGKTDFAYRVIRPNADTIDFNGFKLILDRFVDVLDEHARTHPMVVAVP